MSLYERLTKTGTLSKPGGGSNPDFALSATVNWMRGLSMKVAEHGINSDYSKEFYDRVSKKNFSEQRQINTILEQLLFALHYCSALHALKRAQRKSDIVRVGILSWYYGIYAAASAMIAAQEGSSQDSHGKTAAAWNQQIAAPKLIAHPFDLRITTLVKKCADAELAKLKAARTMDRFNLAGPPPQTYDEAYAACYAYLSGSVDWRRRETEKNLKSSTEFKNLGVSDFKTKKAKGLRDSRFKNKTVGFLHQAYRYREKANYRDALFLGYRENYGENTEEKLGTYIDDLLSVLGAFVCQAGIFCSRRLGKDVWNEFLTDLESNRLFSLSPYSIWGNS